MKGGGAVEICLTSLQAEATEKSTIEERLAEQIFVTQWGQEREGLN